MDLVWKKNPPPLIVLLYSKFIFKNYKKNGNFLLNKKKKKKKWVKWISFFWLEVKLGNKAWEPNIFSLSYRFFFLYEKYSSRASIFHTSNTNGVNFTKFLKKIYLIQLYTYFLTELMRFVYFTSPEYYFLVLPWLY